MKFTQEFIVAEISKNWKNGQEEMINSGLICQQFERVINVNFKRGYELHSFQLHRTFVGEAFNETIIAVFQRTPYFGET